MGEELRVPRNNCCNYSRPPRRITLRQEWERAAELRAGGWAAGGEGGAMSGRLTPDGVGGRATPDSLGSARTGGRSGGRPASRTSTRASRAGSSRFSGRANRRAEERRITRTRHVGHRFTIFRAVFNGLLVMRAMGVGAEHIEMISKQKGAISLSDAPIFRTWAYATQFIIILSTAFVFHGRCVVDVESDGNMEYDHARMISPTVLALWTITEPRACFLPDR